MLRRSLHGDSEKIAIGRGIEKMHRRNTLRSFPVFLAVFVVFVTAAAFVMTAPIAAQDANAAAPTKQSANDEMHGVYRIGGDVSAPVLIHQVEPIYPERARRDRVAGTVLVNLTVDPNGNPSHVRVIRGVAADLDESAIDAVKHYKFKPAMKNGKPVPVQVNLEVYFKIN